MADETAGISETKRFAGLPVTVKTESVVAETLTGQCVEVNEAGVLLQMTQRGYRVTEFIPWTCIKKMTHMESEKAKVASGAVIG